MQLMGLRSEATWGVYWERIACRRERVVSLVMRFVVLGKKFIGVGGGGVEMIFEMCVFRKRVSPRTFFKKSYCHL